MQRSGGALPEAQARSLLVGIGPAVPPPTMAGLPIPRPTVTQQTWQSAPQIPGARLAAPPPASAAGAFPPMPAADAQRYRDVFARLDTDHDGYVEVCCSILPPKHATSKLSAGCWLLVRRHVPREITAPGMLYIRPRAISLETRKQAKHFEGENLEAVMLCREGTALASSCSGACRRRS